MTNFTDTSTEIHVGDTILHVTDPVDRIAEMVSRAQTVGSASMLRLIAGRSGAVWVNANAVTLIRKAASW